MAYRFTPTTHNDPVAFAGSFASIMDIVKCRYTPRVVSCKADEYGEGWVKVEGQTVGYIDQGPLIRES